MQTHSDDQLLFADETSKFMSAPASEDRWNILVVDDEEGVHTITELALDRMKFQGKKLNHIHAYSGREAREIMARTEDIAIILLDVVMEEEDAGLQVADYIRESLGNTSCRIILRTGQAGKAPEEEVVTRYDINDYKEKSELTYKKLFSCVYTGLRSYRDIVALEKNRRGLEKVIEASSTILVQHSMENFAEGVLEQLAALLRLDTGVILAEYRGAVAQRLGNDVRILAKTGKFDESNTGHVREVLEVTDEKEGIIVGDKDIHYVANCGDYSIIMYMAGEYALEDVDRHVISLFCKNVTVAFDNVRLNDNLRKSQKEIVYSLCELAETRSKETGNHVRRVAYYSRLLAEAYGLSKRECDEVLYAAPLHDVGKIGIPDAVLNKPAKLDADEWEIMKTHTTIGADIMMRSSQPIMKAGAIIAEHHHENWDGSGYPKGLAGDDIHIYGRIVALADVFDALASKRCYKDAWDYDRITQFICGQSEVKFDPALVEIFVQRQSDFIDVFERYLD